jgi:hypothetical protein
METDELESNLGCISKNGCVIQVVSLNIWRINKIKLTSLSLEVVMVMNCDWVKRFCGKNTMNSGNLEYVTK